MPAKTVVFTSVRKFDGTAFRFRERGAAVAATRLRKRRVGREWPFLSFQRVDVVIARQSRAAHAWPPSPASVAELRLATIDVSGVHDSSSSAAP